MTRKIYFNIGGGKSVVLSKITAFELEGGNRNHPVGANQQDNLVVYVEGGQKFESRGQSASQLHRDLQAALSGATGS